MFESPYTIVVNQAGFYGIPRPVARRARRAVPQAAAAVGQAQRHLARAVRRHEAPPDDRARADARAATADTRRADRRRRHRDPPLHVGFPARDQRARHHHHPHHPLPGGSRDAVPQHRHHQRRAHRRARPHEQPAAPAARADFRAQPARGARRARRRCRATSLALVDDHTLEVEVSNDENLNDIFARLSGARHRGALHAQQGEPPGGDLHAAGRGAWRAGRGAARRGCAAGGRARRGGGRR